MYKFEWTYKVGALDESDREFYERNNPGYVCTGETLEERYQNLDVKYDSGSTTYVVFKAKKAAWTPYGMCRDLGDHYIIAKWTHYVRVDKATLTRTADVEDM